MFLNKRGGVFYLWWTDETGKRRKVSTHAKTKPDALTFLREFNLQEAERRRALKPVTLSAFRESFLIFSRSIHTPKTVDANATALQMFMQFIGDNTPMHTVTPSDGERFLAAVTVRASAWSARKYRLALAAMFERAKTWGHVSENPWRKVTKPRPPQVLPAYFTRAEFKTLLGVIVDRDFRELVTVAAFTGLRLGELRAMRWDWLDLTRRTVTVKNSCKFTTKSKRARVVPLCDEALTVLLSRPERSRSELVFHRHAVALTGSSIAHRFKDAVRAAGLPDRLHFHSVCHLFASWLVQGGVSLYQVGKLLGHSSTAVTEMYSHLVPSEMHEVLKRLSSEN